MNLRAIFGCASRARRSRCLRSCGLAVGLFVAPAAMWSFGVQCTAAEEPAPAEAAAPLTERMQWVRIGAANNRADGDAGPGHVADEFMLGRFEVTNLQFCEFLNATECGRLNQDGIACRTDATGQPIGPAKSDLDEQGGAEAQRAIGIIATPLQNGDFRYAPTRVMGPKPVVNLRWCDAARMANWLHNGAMPGAATETGAYELDPEQFSDEYAVALQPGARVWIPSLDEWYKAAYYDPFANGGKFREFPTLSGEKPTPVKAAAPNGTGAPPPNLVIMKDFANFEGHAKWSLPPAKPILKGKKPVLNGPVLCNVTSVGTNGRSNPFDAFDMAGNAAEIVTTGAAPGPFRPLACGGHYESKDAELKRANLQKTELREKLAVTGGLRLARLVTDDDPPPMQPGKRGFAQQIVEKLEIDFPPRVVGQATPEAFKRISDVLQARRNRLQVNPGMPDWGKQCFDDALKAVAKMKQLAEQRDANAQQILLQAQALNGILPVGPAADALLRGLNGNFEADLRGPYNEFERAKDHARQNANR